MKSKRKKLDWLRADLPIAEAVSHAQLDAYTTLKKAFKARAEKGMTLSKMADKLRRDKSQVSRLMNGAGAGMSLETLAAYLAVLEHDLVINAVPYEDMPSISDDALSILHPPVNKQGSKISQVSTHTYVLKSPHAAIESQARPEAPKFKTRLVPCP